MITSSLSTAGDSPTALLLTEPHCTRLGGLFCIFVFTRFPVHVAYCPFHRSLSFCSYAYFLFAAGYMFLFFFFNDPATTEIYTLSLHDALPIFEGFWPPIRTECFCPKVQSLIGRRVAAHIDISQIGGEFGDLCIEGVGHRARPSRQILHGDEDRKSTRLNSSHVKISYAVFCLKK